MSWNTLTAAKTESGAIKRWVSNNEVDSEELVGESENWLAQRMRVRGMERYTTDVVLGEGDSEIDLVSELSDFLDPVTVRIQGQCRLRFVSEEEIFPIRGEDEEGNLSSSTPSAYTIINNTMLFDVEADQDYTLIIVYYAKPTELAADNQTNLYTEKYRVLFKAVAMGFAYVFLKDETRATQMFASAEGHLASLMETDDLVRRGQEYLVEVNY